MSHPVIIVQARMQSTRLRGKVLLPLCGKPMLWHIVQRCRAVPGIAEVVVATTNLPGDYAVCTYCAAEEIPWYAGSEHDVLDRYYQAALSYEADPVLRVTGDCPLIDPGVIAEVLRMHQGDAFDLVGAATGAGALHVEGFHFPDGLDVECYSMACLARMWREAKAPQDREHVSTYALRNSDMFDIGRVYAPGDLSVHRWTVDHPEDAALVQAVYEALWSRERHFTMQDVLAYLAEYPEVYALNRRHVGQEGYAALWKTSGSYYVEKTGMSVAMAKLRSRLTALQAYGHHDSELVAFADYLIRLLAVHTQPNTTRHDNYRVLSPCYHAQPWFSIATGTKDYCIGYAEAQQDGSIVACGTFVCWPEERWGEELEGESYRHE